jgi:hypothetical protein
MAGVHAKAVELLDRSVALGFFAADYHERMSPFFVALRDRDDFRRTVARAYERRDAFAAALADG